MDEWMDGWMNGWADKWREREIGGWVTGEIINRMF